uniref:Chloride channel CLIC-like protein 1 n=1 Tax=Panagrolaimus sp. PS1159 TaxID=55785 RepID=A0AC35G396_9BILA
MHILLCIGLLFIGINGSENELQQSSIEEFDVPGDPFSDSYTLPKVNLDDKKCDLQEHTKEYQKVIKECEQKYKNLVESNSAEVDAFFKQFIEQFAYRLDFKFDDSNNINRTAVIEFTPKDIKVLKDYISKTAPTKTLRTQAKDKLIKSISKSFDASPLARSLSFRTEIIITGVIICIAFVLFSFRLFSVAKKQVILSTIIVSFLTIFMTSCWSHYNMRLEETTARFMEKQSKFTGKECDHLSLWQRFNEYYWGFITIKRDSSCYELKFFIDQNIKHQVKLSTVVGEVITDWILSGLNVIGQPVRTFCDTLFKDAPLQMIPLLITFLYMFFFFIFLFLFIGTLWLFEVSIQSQFLRISFGSKNGETRMGQQQQKVPQIQEFINAITTLNNRFDNFQKQNIPNVNRLLKTEKIENIPDGGPKNPQIAESMEH